MRQGFWNYFQRQGAALCVRSLCAHKRLALGGFRQEHAVGRGLNPRATAKDDSLGANEERADEGHDVGTHDRSKDNDKRGIKDHIDNAIRSPSGAAWTKITRTRRPHGLLRMSPHSESKTVKRRNHKEGASRKTPGHPKGGNTRQSTRKTHQYCRPPRPADPPRGHRHFRPGVSAYPAI